MNDLPRQKLREMIASYGRSLCDEPRRVEALLRDLCGGYRKEINLLINALKERVAADMLSSSHSKMPRAMLIARLSKRLENSLALSPDAAHWAVESWALALGVVSKADLKTLDTARSTSRKPPRRKSRKPSAKPPRPQSAPAQEFKRAPAAAPSRQAPHEQRPPEVSRRSSRFPLLAVLLFGAVLVIGGYYAYSYFKRLEDKQNRQAQRERFLKRLDTITPSTEEIAQLRTLEAQAKQEWQEAKRAGKKETASRRAQEYSYYRSTIRFAEGMRNAYIELHTGNHSFNNHHTGHIWRNNKGQLSIMLREYRGLPSPLANKIRRWTQDP